MEKAVVIRRYVSNVNGGFYLSHVDQIKPSSLPSDRGWQIANQIIEGIQNFLFQYEVCGGLRRGNDTISEIDIVVFPADFFGFSCQLGTIYPIESSHGKYTMKIDGLPVAIWIAYDIFQYEVLKLVKTGSAGFILKMQVLAHEKDLALKYTKGLYGLYGAIKSYNKELKKWQWYHNPLRRVWYLENDMINVVMENETFLNPHNRNIVFAPYGKWVEDE